MSLPKCLWVQVWHADVHILYVCMDSSVCLPHFFYYLCVLSVDLSNLCSCPRWDEPCVCHPILAECQADPSSFSSLHPASETMQRPAVNWNEWVTQCKLAGAKWKCQVRHGSLLFVCRRPRLTGEPKQNNAQAVTVSTSLLPFHVTPLCLAACGQRKWERESWQAKVQETKWCDVINLVCIV